MFGHSNCRLTLSKGCIEQGRQEGCFVFGGFSAFRGYFSACSSVRVCGPGKQLAAVVAVADAACVPWYAAWGQASKLSGTSLALAFYLYKFRGPSEVGR